MSIAPNSHREIVETISINIKAERLRAGLSQRQLADRTGLSVRYISRLETTRQNIRIDKIGLIARALGVPPSRLLAHSNEAVLTESARETLAETIRLLQGLMARIE
jgi:transcriptional regulator with XRE-family HTH domain